MSYYPPISRNEFNQMVAEWGGMFDPNVTVLVGGFNYLLDNIYWPWINDFKISRTLNGLQSFIDNNRTYAGAVHRVVDDLTSGNNGLYVIMNGNNGLEYRKIASSTVTLIQNPALNQFEAQTSWFTAVGDNVESNYNIDGPFKFTTNMLSFNGWWSNGRYPNEGFTVADDLDMAQKICSPIDAAPNMGYDYLSWPGKYISVVNDSNTSNNGLYYVSGSTYPDMRLIKLAFDQNNPVAGTISISAAEQEYWDLFPLAKQIVDSKAGYERKVVNNEFSAFVGVWYPMEAFSVFRTFEAMQAYMFKYSTTSISHTNSKYEFPNSFNGCYPGKIVSVTDDPDSTKNGLYMVTADIYQFPNRLRMSDFGLIKMTTE